MTGFPSHQPYLNIALASSLLAFFVALPSLGILKAILVALSAAVGTFLLPGLIAWLISRLTPNDDDSET